MKVVLFCGGAGMRLRGYIDDVPKPMALIGTRPILWHLMKYYAHYGHKEFILCLGYKGHVIKDYFLNYRFLTNDITLKLGHAQDLTFHGSQAAEDWTITLADTGEDTMTGGRVKRIEKYIKGD